MTALKTFGSVFLDEKNRKVILVEENGVVERYYDGPDVQGIIMSDIAGEYVLHNGQKRYWRGIIDPMPEAINQLSIEPIGFIVLKPDCVKRNLVSDVISELESADIEIVTSKRVHLSSIDVYRLYPYFHTPDWEEELVIYMSSGESVCLITRLDGFSGNLKQLRIRIREMFRDKQEESKVVNVIHISDSSEDSLREALIFFDLSELRSPGG